MIKIRDYKVIDNSKNSRKKQKQIKVILKNINQQSLYDVWQQGQYNNAIKLKNDVTLIKSPITDDDIYLSRYHTPWLLLRQFNKNDNRVDVHKIIYKNTFYILLNLDIETMKKTNKILVTLEK